jgi:tol-pal system protein YbgF
MNGMGIRGQNALALVAFPEVRDCGKPCTELSDNAQFWVGKTYYQKKDFEKAILEYEKVIVKYPEGDKVSAALFKQALAFSDLGDKTNARNLLKRVIERYPQSDQADMAKKRLEALK